MVTWKTGLMEKPPKCRSISMSTTKKSLITPKYVTTKWLKGQQFEETRNIINHQKLKKFLGSNGCIYLDLVKVFYTNLTFDGENVENGFRLSSRGGELKRIYFINSLINGVQNYTARINMSKN